MKKLLIFVIIVSAYSASFAQPFIAVHSTGSTNYYSSFQQAVDSAVNNDTIYVPGGSFNIGTLSIDKTLFIYGVGYFPDSCSVTSPSIFLGNLRILSGADGGILSGIKITGDVKFGTNTDNQTVHNYTITRCRITSQLFLSYNGSSRSESTGTMILESVVNGSFYGGYASTTIIKCIFSHYFHYVENSFIGNCDIIYKGYNQYSYYVSRENFYYVLNSRFENNIILNYLQDPLRLDSYTSGNQFYNNIFKYNVAIDESGNSGENNLIGVTPTFINVADLYTYSTDNDYQLDPASEGKGAGTDGMDIGIYGTAYPFKHVPANPHVFSKTIETQLSEDGELNVSVGVSAQDR